MLIDENTNFPALTLPLDEDCDVNQSRSVSASRAGSSINEGWDKFVCNYTYTSPLTYIIICIFITLPTATMVLFSVTTITGSFGTRKG